MSLPPTYKRPTAPQVAKAIRWYCALPGNECGGSLHAVLDDYNWKPVHIRGTYTRAVEEDDGPTQMLCLLLLALSHTARKRAIQMGTALGPLTRKRVVPKGIGHTTKGGQQ